MPKFSIELTGMFPRSEGLVAATRDFDRKRITELQLKNVLHRQQAEVWQLQKELAVDLFSDGMLNWQDIFRPLTSFCRGVEPVTLTRFADTNTFFRQPRIDGPLKYKRGFLNEYFAGLGKKGKWKATLPAPFFLARVADNRYYASTRQLTLAFTDILVHLINDLSKSSYCSFQLFDPYLGYLGVTKPELRLIIETSQKLVRKTKAAIGYHIAFNCPKQAVAALLKTDLEAIGIDFFQTDIKTLPSFQEKKALIAGCLDSRTSLIENPKTLVTFLQAVVKQVKPKQVQVTSNIDLQFVPVDIAQKKLIQLQKAIQLFTRKEKV